jgi:hypothetical protein
MLNRSIVLTLTVTLFAACPAETSTEPVIDTGPGQSIDSTQPDIAIDTSIADINAQDATQPTEDVVATNDVGIEWPGDKQTPWGVISGACGSITDAVQSSQGTLLQTTYTFEDEASFDSASLTGRAKKRYDEPNAGGSSKCSEVMSMQLLIDCEGATVLKTETDIVYDTEGKIADYLVDIGGIKTGVSVTRAYKGPVVDVYTLDDANTLLEKKLSGLVEAQTNVSAEDAWQASMVHIWTLHPAWADTVAQAWNALDEATKGNALVLITVEEGSDYIVSDACDG